MKIYDADGNERDWEWAKGKYNLPDINKTSRDYDHWEVVALHENCRDSSMTVRIVGEPFIGMHVAFCWRDEKGRVQKVVQTTDVNGQTGFGMGGGAYYQPPNHGPHWVYIVDVDDVGNDIAWGLGMLGKRDHWHLEPTFQFVKASPGEPPEEDGWEERYHRLHREYDLLVDGLEDIRQIVGELIGVD